MSFFVYDSAIEDQVVAAINFQSDTFKAMLLTANYIPSKRAHARRSDISPNEVSGPGYDRGGKIAAVTISRDSGSDFLDITLGGVEWLRSTLNAKSVVYYKSRGGQPNNDELIAYIGFEKIVSTLNGKFEITESLIRFLNRAEETA